ncbi:DUF2877 domain-containing protein [Sporosalibacterium faouarense]|uniref:DUF2877 domain-containing protein n=1 Tax=Sporosalibacterium faouarense TaxID=516123 RepID=UPI00141C1BBD|nr:DUF2877 domain-containing protein [Sporosalibacterium faouarense]MTI47430.1 DUF2877 domain-containing protein [Bacillota bacterium]
MCTKNQNKIFFNSLSCDEGFLDHFQDKKDYESIGKIHTIFNKVINIVYGNRIYSIAALAVDNSPYTLRIDNKGCSFKELNLIVGNSAIKIRNSLILGNKIVIKLYNTKLWKPSNRKINIKNVKVAERNIIKFNEKIVDKGINGGCKYFYESRYLEKYKYKPSLVERELSNRIKVFTDEVYKEKVNISHINSLIGLGMGLTPSGDDFLSGFLSTISIINSKKTNKISQRIIRDLNLEDISTTYVSRQMLMNTFEGRYKERILKLIYSFINENESEFIKSLDRVLAIGSSSGTDLAIGIATAFILAIDFHKMEG